MITNYDYPINIYYDKQIKDSLAKLANKTNKEDADKNSIKATDEVSLSFLYLFLLNLIKPKAF